MITISKLKPVTIGKGENAKQVFRFQLSTNSTQVASMAVSMAQMLQCQHDYTPDKVRPVDPSPITFISSASDSITQLHVALNQVPEQGTMPDPERPISARIQDLVNGHNSLEGIQILEQALLEIQGLPLGSLLYFALQEGPASPESTINPAMATHATPGFRVLYQAEQAQLRHIRNLEAAVMADQPVQAIEAPEVEPTN